MANRNAISLTTKASTNKETNTVLRFPIYTALIRRINVHDVAFLKVNIKTYFTGGNSPRYCK
jgi:hypothetical protein